MDAANDAANAEGAEPAERALESGAADDVASPAATPRSKTSAA